MEKRAKNRASYTRYFLTRFMAAILVILCVPVCSVLVFIIVFYAYASFGSVRSSPDPSLVPTAEYLYEHPQLMDYVRIDEREDSDVCYELVPSEDYDSAYTELYLNGARLPPMLYFFYPRGGPLKRDSESPIRRCIRGSNLQLEEGFHLLELVLKSTPWTVYSTYQWAIKVEE